jgi:23S rRNA (uracil1939-C5)-methyltransferase
MKFIRTAQGLKKAKTASTHPLAGTEFVGTVNHLAFSGAGVMLHPLGYKVFVRGVWTGETVRVAIRDGKKDWCQADVIAVELPHPERITPACAHADVCGGCSWQFMAYSAQVRQKSAWVEQAFTQLLQRLSKNPKNPPSDWLKPLIPSEALGYRNRVEWKSDGRKLGLLAAQTHELIDIQACPVLTPALQTQLQSLREQLPNPAWQPPAKARFSLLACDDVGTPKLNQRLGFRQGNSAQNAALHQWLDAELHSQVKAHETAIELFCGDGNFTRRLAAHPFAKIAAYESDPEAIARLEAEALPRVVASRCDLADPQAMQALCAAHAEASWLLMDPPREGLLTPIDWQNLPQLRRILYISCDLTHCIRDLESLLKAGFVLNTVTPLDMFAQTPHIELCVSLSKKPKRSAQP